MEIKNKISDFVKLCKYKWWVRKAVKGYGDYIKSEEGKLVEEANMYLRIIVEPYLDKHTDGKCIN